MNPQKYIKDNTVAMEYFRQFEKILKSRSMDDDDYASELSRLSNECARYQDCQVRAAKREKDGLAGFWNEFDNGTIQVNALHTISKDSSTSISQLIARFGFTPSDFSKIKDLVKPAAKESVMDGLMNVSIT